MPIRWLCKATAQGERRTSVVRGVCRPQRRGEIQAHDCEIDVEISTQSSHRAKVNGEKDQAALGLS